MKSIDYYNVGDEVDIFAEPTDAFTDFSGTITMINYESNLIQVLDEDGDSLDVTPRQIQLTYNEKEDATYN